MGDRDSLLMSQGARRTSTWHNSPGSPRTSQGSAKESLLLPLQKAPTVASEEAPSTILPILRPAASHSHRQLQPSEHMTRGHRNAQLNWDG